MPRSPGEGRWVSDWPGRQPAGKADPAGDKRSHPETWVLAMSQGHECPDISHPLSTEEAIPHTHGPHRMSTPPSGKSLGVPTTGPRSLLTGNLTPVPREASVWYTCQMSTWDSAGGQVGSLMPGGRMREGLFLQHEVCKKTQLLPLTAWALILLAQAFCTLVWILQCACGSSEEMVCFLLRRPVSYSHASRQVARWVTWRVPTNNHPPKQSSHGPRWATTCL